MGIGIIDKKFVDLWDRNSIDKHVSMIFPWPFDWVVGSQMILLRVLQVVGNLGEVYLHRVVLRKVYLQVVYLQKVDL